MRHIHSALSALLVSIVTAGSLSAQQPAPKTPTPTPPSEVICSKSFQELDTNKDGVLTTADFSDAAQRDFIGKADTNKDGIVTVAEYNAGCSKNLLHKADK